MGALFKNKYFMHVGNKINLSPISNVIIAYATFVLKILFFFMYMSCTCIIFSIEHIIVSICI